MRDLLPNHPLVEAVFEIRFPAELRIEAARHEYYSLIKSDFPEIFVPRIVSDQPQAFLRYRFRAQDGKREVQFSINSFSVHLTEYPGYPKARPTVVTLFKTFLDLFGITSIKRLGLRYINVIPAVRGENRVLPLKDFLTWIPSLPAPLATWPITDLQHTTAFAVPDGHLGLVIAFEEEEGPRVLKSQFKVDIDSVVSTPFAAAQLGSRMDDRHQLLDDVFFACVSEGYLSDLRGQSHE